MLTAFFYLLLAYVDPDPDAQRAVFREVRSSSCPPCPSILHTPSNPFRTTVHLHHLPSFSSHRIAPSNFSTALPRFEICH